MGRDLAHVGLLILHGLEPTLEDLERDDNGGPGPEEPVEGGKGCVGAGGGADGATAEEQFADEDGEGDEAGEVEEGV